MYLDFFIVTARSKTLTDLKTPSSDTEYWHSQFAGPKGGGLKLLVAFHTKDQPDILVGNFTASLSV